MSFIISDINYVKPLVLVHFNTCYFVLNLTIEVGCAMLFNVVITVISAYGPHLHTLVKNRKFIQKLSL